MDDNSQLPDRQEVPGMKKRFKHKTYKPIAEKIITPKKQFKFDKASVDVDTEGNVYICDYSNHVAVLSKEQFMEVWQSVLRAS